MKTYEIVLGVLIGLVVFVAIMWEGTAEQPKPDPRMVCLQLKYTKFSDMTPDMLSKWKACELVGQN